VISSKASGQNENCCTGRGANSRVASRQIGRHFTFGNSRLTVVIALRRAEVLPLFKKPKKCDRPSAAMVLWDTRRGKQERKNEKVVGRNSAGAYLETFRGSA
jgi:hypothetical protein